MDNIQFEAFLGVLNRIALALEAQHPADDDQTITLIEFREIKDAEPIGRKAEVALKHAPAIQTPALPGASASVSGPLKHAPATTPALPGASASVSDPLKLADAISAVVPQPPRRDPIPDALRAEWVAAYDAAGKGGTVPAEWHITAEDTPATLAVKINALRLMVDTTPEPQSAPALAPTPAPEPAIEPTYDELLAAARIVLADHAAQFLKAATGATKQQIADVKAVLIAHAGDEGEAGMRRALVALFDRNTPNGSQVLALFEWLRPARGTGGVYAANKAAREIVERAVLAQPQPQPAQQLQPQLEPA